MRILAVIHCGCGSDKLHFTILARMGWILSVPSSFMLLNVRRLIDCFVAGMATGHLLIVMYLHVFLKVVLVVE